MRMSNSWLALAVLAGGCSGAGGPVRETPEAAALVAQLRHDFQVPYDYHHTTIPQAAMRPPSTAGDVKAVLPRSASATMTVSRPVVGVDVKVRLVDALDVAGEAGEGFTVYRGAHASGATLVRSPIEGGVEDYLRFAAQPAAERVAYELELPAAVKGLRQPKGSPIVEMVNEHGNPVLRMAALWIVGRDAVRRMPHVDVQGCAVDASGQLPWGKAPTAPGADHCRVEIAWDGLGVTYPALLDPSWTSTFTMSVPTSQHAAMLVTDGGANSAALVVAGGTAGVGTTALSSWAPCQALPPDPMQCAWANAGNLPGSGNRFGAVMVQSNMTAPGASVRTSILLGAASNGSSSSAIYNEWSGQGGQHDNSWHFHNASMVHERAFGFTGTFLNYGAAGKVLLVGGEDHNGNVQNSAEVYDIATDTFTAINQAPTAVRDYHSAVVLGGAGDRVLIAGGTQSPTSWEIFKLNPNNVAASTFTAGSGAIDSHADGKMAMLTDGRVLYIGSQSNKHVSVFDPSVTAGQNPPMGTWYSMPDAPLGSRFGGLAPMPARMALMAGGFDSNVGAYNNAYIYRDDNHQSVATNAMASARWEHQLTALGGGRIVATGGNDGNTDLNSSEEFYGAAAGTGCTLNSECLSGWCVTKNNQNICCDAECECGDCSTGHCQLPQYGLKPAECGGRACDGVSLTCPPPVQGCDDAAHACQPGYKCDQGTLACVSCQGLNPGGQTPIGLPWTEQASQHYQAMIPRPAGAKVGTLNKDLYPDVVVVDAMSDTVSTFLGGATGIAVNQAPTKTYNVGAGKKLKAVALGDINKDGLDDIVIVANDGQGNPWLIYGTSDGAGGVVGNTWTSKQLANGLIRAVDVALGDYDGDKWIDVVVGTGNKVGNAAAVLGVVNNGSGGFTAAVVNVADISGFDTSTPGRVALTDFNGDGKPDLVVGTWDANLNGGGGVYVLPNAGNGVFTTAGKAKLSLVTDAANTQVAYVAVADFNKDGKLDIALIDNNALNQAQNFTYTRVEVCLGGVFPAFSACTVVEDVKIAQSQLKYEGLSVADVDNDTAPDLLVTRGAWNTDSETDEPQTPGYAKVFRSFSAGVFQANSTIATPDSPRIALAADYQPDDCASELDLVVIHGYYDNQATHFGVVGDFKAHF